MKVTTSTFLYAAFLVPAALGADPAECDEPPTQTGYYSSFSPSLSNNNPCVGSLGFAREYRFETDAQWAGCPECSTNDCSAGCAENWPKASKDNDCDDSCPVNTGLQFIKYCCKYESDTDEWNNMQICNMNNFDIWLTSKGGPNQYFWGKLSGNGACTEIDGSGGTVGSGDGNTPALSHVNICVNDCSGGGGAMGDPHIFKWNGDYFDYHGECDLLLVDAPKFGSGAGMTVQIRTKQLEELGYSYIENAAIRIGKDILEVAGYGKYFLNGVADVPMPAQVADSFEVTYAPNPEEYKYEYTIDAGNGISVVVSTLGAYVSIDVKRNARTVANEWFGGATGLMGSFNGTLLARDGVTVMDDTGAFGQEWQVLETETNLFQDKDRAPQHPTKCIAPPATTERRLRGISVEAAQNACAHVTNHKSKQACIFDVQATNDMGIANIY